MRLPILLLVLLMFGCTVEKRIHRRGFHIKKNRVSHDSKIEKNTSKLSENRDINLYKNLSKAPISDQNRHVEDQNLPKDFSEKEAQKKTKSPDPNVVVNTENLNVQNGKKKDIAQRSVKKKEVFVSKKERKKASGFLSVIANILAIMSFIFAILTVLATILSFLASLSLIIPLLPAIAALYASGLSFLLNLFNKDAKYNSGLALIGLITALIFFTFFILVLAGVILI